MNARQHLLPALGLFLAVPVGAVRAQYQCPIQNPDRPIEERVNNAVSLMNSALGFLR